MFQQVQKEIDKRLKSSTASQIWSTLPLTGKKSEVRALATVVTAVHGNITLGVAVGRRCIADQSLGNRGCFSSHARTRSAVPGPANRNCPCQ